MASNSEALLLVAAGDNSQMATEATNTDAPPEQLEAIPPELLAIFGESAALASTTALPENTPEPAEDRSPTTNQLNHLAQEVASSARVQAFAVSDLATQLNQIAGLIVQNSEDVQSAWAASQQLEATARRLADLVKYFE